MSITGFVFASMVMLAMTLLHVQVAPFSKVEESFSLHATHDLLHRCAPPLLPSSSFLPPLPVCNISSFDHIEFPGVVPRTFLPPLALAASSSALSSALSLLSSALSTPPTLASSLSSIISPASAAAILATPPLSSLPDIHTATAFLRSQPGVRSLLALASSASWIYLASGLVSWSSPLLSSIAPGVNEVHPSGNGSGKKKGASVVTRWWSVGSLMLLGVGFSFHLPFYAGRMLPNTFALILVNLALGSWFRNAWLAGPVLALSVAVPLVRAEIVGLLGPLVLYGWIFESRPVLSTLAVGTAVGLATIGLSVWIDSLFWQRTLWPEGEVLYFNTVLNKSSEWGTSPWTWYFARALPKALMGALPGLALAPFVLPWRTLLALAGPPGMYVFLYSFLPHKELRFVFYALPPLFALASLAYAAALAKARAWWSKTLVVLVVIGILAASLVAAGGMLYISSHNYPGGIALAYFNHHVAGKGESRLHIDADAAMTGVSLFEQKAEGVTYAKTEGLSDADLLAFTHLLSSRSSVPGFSVITPIQAYSGLTFPSPCPYAPQVPVCVDIVLSPHLYIHRNNNN